LPNGSKLAVKSLTKAHQGIDDFLNEVVAITDVKHKNLVKLKGCCLHGIQRYLVYEYVENKNLGEALWHDCQEGHSTLFLDWPRRFIICMDIAHGLTYLHEFLNPCIIHRDIKATNILLDMNLNAKIADFGLARLFPNDQTHIVTKYIAGTFGYLSPEYASLGELTTKVDVYSFGILLLEIISGRKSIDDALPREEMYLVKWAWSLHEKNMLINLVDQKLNNTIVDIELQRVAKVALLCVQQDPRRRPLMSRVLLMLQGEMEIEVAFGEFELQTNIYEKQQASCMDGSSSESSHLLFQPMPNKNNQNSAEIEIQNFGPR
jgi:serine/threonine protein kinase